MQAGKIGYVMRLHVAWRKIRLVENCRQFIIQPPSSSLFSSVNSVPSVVQD
ncbi:hypothetical protein D3C83_167850 [compost metagenome]